MLETLRPEDFVFGFFLPASWRKLARPIGPPLPPPSPLPELKLFLLGGIEDMDDLERDTPRCGEFDRRFTWTKVVVVLDLVTDRRAGGKRGPTILLSFDLLFFSESGLAKVAPTSVLSLDVGRIRDLIVTLAASSGCACCLTLP
jgi:hypothetical protein